MEVNNRKSSKMPFGIYFTVLKRAEIFISDDILDRGHVCAIEGVHCRDREACRRINVMLYSFN